MKTKSISHPQPNFNTPQLDQLQMEIGLKFAETLNESDYPLIKKNNNFVDVVTRFPSSIRSLSIKSIGRIERWKAHVLGLRHQSVGIWIISPHNQLLLKQRAPHLDLFPGAYGTSASGHMDYKNVSDEALPPLQFAQMEVAEELGITIEDLNRFKPVIASGAPLRKFSKTWAYKGPKHHYFFHQFDDKAKIIGCSYRGPDLTTLNYDIIKNLIQVRELTDEYLGESNKSLKLQSWNEELCYYYTLKISEEELSQIHFADGETQDLNPANTRDIEKSVQELNCTDSTYHLVNNATAWKAVKSRLFSVVV